MQRLEVDLGTRRYPILIGAGLVDRADVVGQAVHARDVLVVTNDVVAPSTSSGCARHSARAGSRPSCSRTASATRTSPRSRA